MDLWSALKVKLIFGFMISFEDGADFEFMFGFEGEADFGFMVSFEVGADFGFMVWQEWRAVWICVLI